MAIESDHENAGIRQSGNDKFILKLDEYIDRNMENEHFGVGELAEAMNLSRMQVYRKVRKITGRNVSQYIREKRLNVALEMLRHNEYTVSEIAYKVGFGSVSYFSNCFRKRYGYPPGQAADLAIKEEQENDEASPVNAGGKRNRQILVAVSVTLILMILASGGYLTFHRVFAKKEKDPVSNADIDREKSIAVMPFINDSPDQENEYFCNGVVDEIFTHLQKITDLKVISKTNAEQYRDKKINTGTVGNELGVSYILTGSVRKIDDDIRITAQLVDVNTSHHLWAETYDGKYTSELFSFQSDVARKVASSLKAVITPAEEKKIDRKPTTEIIAYDLMIQGFKQITEFDITGNSKYFDSAILIFNRAISADPAYSRSYFGKGHAFLMNNQLDSAIYYGKIAIELDPEIHYGYHLIGSAYNLMCNKPDLAIEYLTKAAALAPPESWPNFILGDTYFYQKKDYFKGLQYMGKSVHVGVPALFNMYSRIGWALLHIGDYDRASDYFKSSMKIRPLCFQNNRGSFLTLASQGKFRELIHYTDSICSVMDCESECSRMKFFIYVYLNENVKAESAFDQFVEYGSKVLPQMGHLERPGVGWWRLDRRQPQLIDSTYIAFVYKKNGKEREALNIIEEITSSYEPDLNDNSPWWNYYNLASVKCLLGEKEKALQYLSKAVDIGLQIGTHDLLEIDPTFETLRDDPEFKSIVRRAQEEKAVIRARVWELIEKGEIDL